MFDIRDQVHAWHKIIGDHEKSNKRLIENRKFEIFEKKNKHEIYDENRENENRKKNEIEKKRKSKEKS